MMSSSEADPATAVFDRLRGVQVDGAGVVEALLAFMRERAALEEGYAKSLSKLSRHGLGLKGEWGWWRAGNGAR
jgi:hypothetical protein